MAVRTSVPTAGLSPFMHLSRSLMASTAVPAPEDEDDLDEADDDEDDDDDDEDDDKGDGKKNKKSKKTKKAEDDCDEEDEDRPAARAIRLRERARIRTIVRSRAGKLLPDAARQLAFGMAMPRHAAVKLLRSMVAALPKGNAAASFRDRMAGVNIPDVGPGDAAQSSGAPDNAKALAAAIIAAGKKARGEV
jgi:hypothetical protein